MRILRKYLKVHLNVIQIVEKYLRLFLILHLLAHCDVFYFSDLEMVILLFYFNHLFPMINL